MTSILKNANVGVLEIGPPCRARPISLLQLIITQNDSLLNDQTLLNWFYIGSFNVLYLSSLYFYSIDKLWQKPDESKAKLIPLYINKPKSYL